MQGIANWRDVGATVDNGIAPGRLYRSGHLADATHDDIEWLKALEIDTIVDLRRLHERAQRPSPDLGTGVTVVSCDLGDAAEPPHVAFMRQSEITPATTEAYLLDYYRNAPYQPRHLHLFTAMFERFNLARGPMLIHCAAGKDRTGLGVALIQSGLNVPYEAVLAEFLRSNELLNEVDKVDEGRRQLQGILKRDPPDFLLHAFLGVHADHLFSAFANIEARSGSVSAYVDHLRSSAVWID